MFLLIGAKGNCSIKDLEKYGAYDKASEAKNINFILVDEQ